MPPPPPGQGRPGRAALTSAGCRPCSPPRTRSAGTPTAGASCRASSRPTSWRRPRTRCTATSPPPPRSPRRDGEAGRWHTWDAPWPEFPFHSSRLNALVVHDNVVDLAEASAGLQRPRALHGPRHGQVRRPALGLQPAPARRLPQPHAGRTPARARLPAGGVLRLPDRRHRRGRRDPVRLVAEDEGHPRRAAHPELRGLRRSLRRPVGRGGTGRLRRRLPPRRVPPLGGLHRSLPLPGDAPRLVPPPRRRLGRLPGLALPRLLLRALQVRPAGHAAPAGAPGRARARPSRTGTRRRWPACRRATQGSTWRPGATRCAERASAGAQR